MSARQNSTTSATGLANLPPAWQRRSLSPKQRNFAHFTLGEQGEKCAQVFLRSLGWEILQTNLRLKHAEVDIIAIDNQTKDLVFVEVKTRRSTKYGSPALAVTRKKLQSLQQISRQYLKSIKWTGGYRFDTIAVSSGKIHHYRNVTWFMK